MGLECATDLTMMETAEKRKLLYQLLGELPERNFEISCEVVSVEVRESYVLETLILDLNGIEPVSAYLARPVNISGKVPAVLFNHSHGGLYHLGKKEFIKGNSYLQQVPYAEAITSLGYIGLCIDHWGFGERNGRTESEIFKEFLWKDRVMWGMMVFDSIRALDYLTSRDEVDASRLATLGISMGSTMAWWLAALDERIKVCIDICCMTDFEELINSRGLDEHSIYYYVPGLLKHFSTSDINALICPRFHLSLNGIYDKLTPCTGLEIIDRNMRVIYTSAGVPERWTMENPASGHMETAQMRKRIIDYLREHL